MEVEPEKARAYSDESNNDEARGCRVGGSPHEARDDVRVDEEGSGTDCDHAGGQAVESIDEVDGVHDADDEQDGDEKPEP